MCVIPVLGRLTQADFHEFRASLDYTNIPQQPRLQSKILFQRQKQKNDKEHIDSVYYLYCLLKVKNYVIVKSVDGPGSHYTH